MASVCQERVSATNLKAFRIDFTKACANSEHSLHIGRPQCSDTIEEATKTFSMFKHIHWSLAFMEGQVNNMQISSTHTVSCDKYKLNPCLKWAKIVQKISFQLSADTGKNKVKSFYNYFYNLQVNLISTHILAQVHFSKNRIYQCTQFKENLSLFSSAYMQQHYPYQKNYRLSKKIIHGRFNKFLFSLNAALRTAQELYTHHYVDIDVLPCDTLQQKSYYKQ